MARRLLRHDIPATYDTDSPRDLPDWIKPSSGLTMLPDTADHEYAQVEDVAHMPSCGPFPKGHTQPTPYAEEPLHTLCHGKNCIRCRTTETWYATWEYQDAREVDYALQAFLQRAIQADDGELFRHNRHGVDFKDLTEVWAPVRDTLEPTWRRATQTSIYFMHLLNTLPHRAQNTFIAAGGARIPTWEWARGQTAEAEGHKHALGVEVVQTSRPPGSRAVYACYMTQDLSNQQYGVVWNLFFARYALGTEINNFRKANDLDMLMGLGRLMRRLDLRQRTHIYERFGDLEDLSRFWEQIVNRAVHLAGATRRGRDRCRPRYEDDESCGENDAGRSWLRHENTMTLDTRSIRAQVITFQDLFEDCWPKRPSGRSRHNGVDGNTYARLAYLNRADGRR